MRELLLICLLGAAVLPQAGTLGAFTRSGDVGPSPLEGAASFDASTGRYSVTGTGTDIWGRGDEFHYLSREISGNFAATATVRFLTDGNPHRKASIMLRKTVDADSPFVHLAIHGDGMAAVQFRSTKADTTNTLDFPVEGPGTYTLKLVRQGGNVTFFVAKEGAPLRELGHTVNQLGSPVLVGLAVASHSREALNTVEFSSVSIEPVAASASPAPGTPATPGIAR